MENHPRKNYSTYRRNNYKTGGRRAYLHREQGSYLETVLMQCIICAVMLAFVLVVNLVNIPAAQNIRVSLKQAFSQDADMPRLAEIWSPADKIDEMRSLVKHMFGDGEENIPDVSPEMERQNAPAVNTDFRIDEDILLQINTREDFYGDALKKPEPLSQISTTE